MRKPAALSRRQQHLPPLAERHRKGIMTLSLLVLAESVALANAVTFWSTYEKWSNEHGSGRRWVEEEDTPFAKGARMAEECSAASSLSEREACPSSPGQPPAKFYPRTRLSKRAVHAGATSQRIRTVEECCAECSDCLRQPDALERCGVIPRGGHAPRLSDVTAAAAESVSHAASSTSTPYGIPLNLWKVIFQAFLTAMNILCWLIPLRSKKISESKLALSIANAFSGGVFLSLAFGHLIPECVHGFHKRNEALPYMIVLGGYLLIFFVEKVAFDAHGLMHAGDEHHPHQQTEFTFPQNGEKGVNGAKGKEVTHEDSGGMSTGRSAVILLGALGVHSVLEMMALGLANNFGDSALLTLSIALHQPAESIALLVAFLKSGMPKSQIIQFLSVFSAMGPLGVAMGMAVSELAPPIVDSIMLAVVAGTFVYVGATEVIPEEWEEQEHKWKKFFALISGIVSIFAITQYTTTLEEQVS